MTRLCADEDMPEKLNLRHVFEHLPPQAQKWLCSIIDVKVGRLRGQQQGVNMLETGAAHAEAHACSVLELQQAQTALQALITSELDILTQALAAIREAAGNCNALERLHHVRQGAAPRTPRHLDSRYSIARS